MGTRAGKLMRSFSAQAVSSLILAVVAGLPLVWGAKPQSQSVVNWQNCAGNSMQDIQAIDVKGSDASLPQHVITASFKAQPATDLETIASRAIIALDADNNTLKLLQHRVQFTEPSNSTYNVTIVVEASDPSNITSLRGIGEAGLWLCLVRDITCGDGSTCLDDQTCRNPYGGYGCCNYPNAFCCGDGLKCCPNGQYCDGDSCVPSSLAWLPKKALNITRSARSTLKANDLPVECPDGSTCAAGGAGSTCCQTQDGWGCCPSADATCCPDEIHCCPPDYPVCDLKAGSCALDDGSSSSPWLLKTKSKPKMAQSSK